MTVLMHMLLYVKSQQHHTVTFGPLSKPLNPQLLGCILSQVALDQSISQMWWA